MSISKGLDIFFFVELALMKMSFWMSKGIDLKKEKEKCCRNFIFLKNEKNNNNKLKC